MGWIVEFSGIPDDLETYDETRVLIEKPAAELAITQPREIGVYLRAFAELAAMAVYGNRARDLISRAITDFR
jgi:hypothetical protein